VPRSGRVLHIGAGNSALPGKLHSAGFTDQVATDISATVIAQMQKDAQRQGLVYQVMDSLALDLPAGSVDAVLDKGMYDAFQVDQKEQILREASRVLRDGGVYMCLSFSKPQYAFEFKAANALREYAFDMQNIPMPKVYDDVPMFLYIGKKVNRNEL
jgi:ubiquinone/menaquinone biosynthesis C-methylase UbiE